MVKVDYIGLIYLAQNAVSGLRLKLVEIRYHFVQAFIEIGVIKIIFVQPN
jgi:hypothetical protein